jgi:transketolase
MLMPSSVVYESCRAVTAEVLHELGEKHDNVWAVTPDIGATLKEFKNDFPDRFVDVGIAEQNAIGISAGLALEGNIPFVVGMIPFLTMRACEQVRTAVCYQNLPVRIIGTGGGLTTGGGATHNAMEDIAITKSFVNMTVVSISEPNTLRCVLQSSMEYPGPIFVRLGQGRKDRVLYEPDALKCEIGKGIVARDGKDATIIAHGEMVAEALDAAETLNQQGIDAGVIDMFTIKPLDSDIILKAVRETGRILVLEDHLMLGGLASSIADVFAEAGVYPKAYRRLGIPQVYAGFGSCGDLRRKYGYDKDAAVSAVKEMMND